MQKKNSLSSESRVLPERVSRYGAVATAVINIMNLVVCLVLVVLLFLRLFDSDCSLSNLVFLS